MIGDWEETKWRIFDDGYMTIDRDFGTNILRSKTKLTPDEFDYFFYQVQALKVWRSEISEEEFERDRHSCCDGTVWSVELRNPVRNEREVLLDHQYLAFPSMPNHFLDVLQDLQEKLQPTEQRKEKAADKRRRRPKKPLF